MWCVIAEEVLPFLEVWKFVMAGSNDFVAQPLGTKIFFLPRRHNHDMTLFLCRDLTGSSKSCTR